MRVPGSHLGPVLWFAEITGGYHNPESRYKMDALAAAGHRLLTVHPIGGASLNLRKLTAAAGHLAGLFRRPPARSAESAVADADVRLLISPVRHGRFTRPLNERLVEHRLRQALASLGGGRPILWLRFPSPELVAVATRMEDALVVYDLIDYIPNRPLGRRGIRATREAERTLVRRADLVLASSERSLERVRPMAQHAVFHPHGVDFGRFATPQPVPDDLASLPRPLIGYTGGDDWVDAGLLESVADRFAAASLVIVGPWGDRPDLRALRSRPNVHLLGARPHAVMPAYMGALDVALLPYRQCIEIEHSAPVKVCEYLATGVSCVGTDVPYLHRFGDVMAVTRDASGFMAAIEAALAGAGPGDPAARRAVAAGEAWDIRNAELVRLVQGALAVRDAQEAPGATPAPHGAPA